MLKKAIMLLLVLTLGVALPLLSGCEQDEVRVEKKTEVQKTEQHTVVE